MCMLRERRRDKPDWVYEAADDDRTLLLVLPGLCSAWDPRGRVGCRLNEFGLLLGECDTETRRLCISRGPSASVSSKIASSFRSPDVGCECPRTEKGSSGVWYGGVSSAASVSRRRVSTCSVIDCMTFLSSLSHASLALVSLLRICLLMKGMETVSLGEGREPSLSTWGWSSESCRWNICWHDTPMGAGRSCSV